MLLSDIDCGVRSLVLCARGLSCFSFTSEELKTCIGSQSALQLPVKETPSLPGWKSLNPAEL